jgi:magnesium transporter
VIVDCAVYENGRRRDGQVPLEHAYDASGKKGTFVWIGLYEPPPEEFDSLKREFELHELAVEDAIHSHQRPKLEVYGDMVFIVLKTARYVDPDEVVRLDEIQVFLGRDFVITVRHGDASELHSVRERLEQEPALLERGPGAVLHAIADRVVDDYFPALSGLEEDVDQVENQVFSTDRQDSGAVAERIYKLKREVLEFHRATAPLIEPLGRLVKGQPDMIHPEVRAYFRDVNDHLMRTRDQLEGLRELLTGVLEANLTQVSVRQNEDMRKISAWVAIIAVPTAIAGIYGMNFRHMPELRWAFGYPAALTLMLVICLALHRSFKRWGWL